MAQRIWDRAVASWAWWVARPWAIAIYVLALALAACGAAPPTAASVLDGLPVTNIAPGVRPADSPAPQSYREWVTFETAGKGGQVFVCDTKRNCDALYAYFDALKAFAGPYLYQSPSGLVVVQLNSGLTPEQAQPFADRVEGMR